MSVPFEELLERSRPELVGFMGGHGGHLLRLESPEDLAQGALLDALHVADGFRYEGDDAFMAWLRVIARQHLARRREHWATAKRRAISLLRIDARAGDTSAPGVDPTASQTGPRTFAERREQLALAMRAVSTLGERDRTLIEAVVQDTSISALAQQLGVSEAAAQRARLRAVDRFRRAFRALSIA